MIHLVPARPTAPILVVDDDPKIVALVRTYLERERYPVVTAGDGRAALRAIEEHAPRLVVLDLMLPEIDGMTVIRRARADGDVPILVLSARSAVGDRVLGLTEGADDYLPKPFSPAELVARVRTILRRTERSPDDTSTTVLRPGRPRGRRGPPPGDRGWPRGGPQHPGAPAAGRAPGGGRSRHEPGPAARRALRARRGRRDGSGHRRLREAAPREARRRSRRAALRGHRPRCRLPGGRAGRAAGRASREDARHREPDARRLAGRRGRGARRSSRSACSASAGTSSSRS